MDIIPSIDPVTTEEISYRRVFSRFPISGLLISGYRIFVTKLVSHIFSRSSPHIKLSIHNNL